MVITTQPSKNSEVNTQDIDDSIDAECFVEDIENEFFYKCITIAQAVEFRDYSRRYLSFNRGIHYYMFIDGKVCGIGCCPETFGYFGFEWKKENNTGVLNNNFLKLAFPLYDIVQKETDLKPATIELNREHGLNDIEDYFATMVNSIHRYMKRNTITSTGEECRVIGYNEYANSELRNIAAFYSKIMEQQCINAKLLKNNFDKFVSQHIPKDLDYRTFNDKYFTLLCKTKLFYYNLEILMSGYCAAKQTFEYEKVYCSMEQCFPLRFSKNGRINEHIQVRSMLSERNLYLAEHAIESFKDLMEKLKNISAPKLTISILDSASLENKTFLEGSCLDCSQN